MVNAVTVIMLGVERKLLNNFLHSGVCSVPYGKQNFTDRME
jgi:hypothetical protein